MDYEKIDACKKNYMLFWKDNKDNTESMHCNRSRYVKVINEYGASVTTKVAVKQLRYIPMTPRQKWLFLCEEIAQQVRCHKERIRDREDPDTMSHPTDVEAWHALDRFDPEFVRDLVYCRLALGDGVVNRGSYVQWHTSTSTSSSTCNSHAADSVAEERER
jgi:hypothetical protein